MKLGARGRHTLLPGSLNRPVGWPPRGPPGTQVHWVTDESCPCPRHPLHPPRGCAPGLGGRCWPPQPSTWLSASPPHTPVGRHSATPLAEPPSAPFIPHERLGVCASQAPGGGGRSWHLPLPSAVPSPEQSTQQVLSDAALNASWCPAPRGPRAPAFPSAVTPWASGRRFHLLPQSPLGGSSFWSLSKERPALLRRREPAVAGT